MLTSARLWRHPAFLRLWTASAISDIGSQVSALAPPLIAALMLDATAWQMGQGKGKRIRDCPRSEVEAFQSADRRWIRPSALGRR